MTTSIERDGTLSAPCRPLEELTEYGGPNTGPASQKKDERHLRSQCADQTLPSSSLVRTDVRWARALATLGSRG